VHSKQKQTRKVTTCVGIQHASEKNEI
jgi:hypothetical protein